VKHILELAVHSFDCTVRLRMISSCLPVRDVKHLAKLKPKVRSVTDTRISEQPACQEDQEK
jgi:hypothetical protein